MNLENKTVSVFGFSPRTGLALVNYLMKFKLNLIIADAKSRQELESLLTQIDLSQIKLALNAEYDLVLTSDLIILSPGVPYDLDILTAARSQGIETISEIEFAYRQNNKAKLIAITGTNGKTTTTELVYKMLQNLPNRKVKLAGNIGIPYISIIEDLTENDIVVLELSSFQLEAVKYFRPELALYLNYSPDHLDRHHTEANYKQAKFKIFANQQQDDIAIIDLDDSYLASLREEITARQLTISNNAVQNADLILQDQQALYPDNQVLLDYTQIKLPGLHNQKNLAFAALAAYLMGQSRIVIQQVAANYKLQAHRMEQIANPKDYLIIDDSKATNPAAAIKALTSLPDQLVLIAGGQDRQADFTQFVEVVCQKAKAVFLIGETAAKLAKLLKDRQIECSIYTEMEAAVKAALKQVDSASPLLLSPACPSWDSYPSYKARGLDFKNNVLKYLS